MEWYLWALLALIVICLAAYYQQNRRRELLMQKYGDRRIVDKIMDGMIWQGQSEGQLIDAIGRPVDIEQKVLKTKTKETWKYNATGKNRYALRVVLEDGVVVGWDKK
jgi:hypothetical protein